MKLQFGPDDGDAFAEAKREILDSFGTWVVQRYGADDGSLVADADTFLSWRFDYSTGDLSDFDVVDVDEFLLVWAPRKFSVGPEEAPILCRAVELMIEFLATTDRLKGGESRAARIMAHVDGLVDDVRIALGDESNFGLAKGILGLNLSDSAGNPLADVLSMLESDNPPSPEEMQGILEERMEIFNSLPMEERLAVTDPLLESREPEPIKLPFMLVPSTAAEVEASARASWLLSRVEGFVRHLGDTGLKLTSAGNLRLADARELVELLETGDEMDPVTFGEVRKTRTSLELRWLTLIEDVAVMVGAVERLKTKLNADLQWLDRPVVDRALFVVEALMYMGPLGSAPTQQVSTSAWIDELLDDGVPHWLARLLPENSSADFDEFVEFAHQVIEQQLASDYADLTARGSEVLIDRHMSDLFDALVRAGIVEWTGRTEARSEFGWIAFFTGGVVSLTPLGRRSMPTHVRAAGYELSTVDDLSDASPVVLLNAVATASVTEDVALAGWRSEDSTESRARLIGEGALAAEHPAQRLAAFSLLRKMEPVEEVAPVVRELLDSSCSGHAAFFLLDTDQATRDEVGMFVSIGPMVDMLYSEVDSPEHLDQLFTATQSRSEVDLLEDMWRHDQPETLELLEALGRHLTDKKMAKAARKAAFKHRSWLANEGR